MLKPILSFLNFSGLQKREVVEAVFFSFWARMCLLFVPFRRFHKSLGKEGYECVRAPLAADVQQQVLRVKKAVEIVARRVPWRCMCFEQAITANRMLKRRDLAGTIYLGVKRDREEAIAAHAWLRTGGMLVTGSEARPQYRPIAAFGWQPLSDTTSLQKWEPIETA